MKYRSGYVILILSAYLFFDNEGGNNEESSYMIGIPEDDAVLKDPGVFMERLKASDIITLRNVGIDEGFIKKGDIRTYPFADITDWLILTKRARITPDDAYLLV